MRPNNEEVEKRRRLDRNTAVPSPQNAQGFFLVRCRLRNSAIGAEASLRHVHGPPANVSPIDHHNRKYTKVVHVDHHFPLHDRFPYSDRLGWGQTVGSKKIGPSDPTRALKFCQSSQLVQKAVYIVIHVLSLIIWCLKNLEPHLGWLKN